MAVEHMHKENASGGQGQPSSMLQWLISWVATLAQRAQAEFLAEVLLHANLGKLFVLFEPSEKLQ